MPPIHPSLLHHRRHLPSVTRTAQVASTQCLISSCPSSLFSKSSPGGPPCVAPAQTPQGLPSTAGEPLPAAPASSQASFQPCSHMAFSQFLKRGSKPFPASSLCTCWPHCRHLSSLIPHLADPFPFSGLGSNCHCLREFFPDSRLKLRPLLYFLKLTEVSFQVRMPTCNYIFVDGGRNH